MKSLAGPRSGIPTSSDTDALYNHGYFHGETSGYPSEGYGKAHPDWTAWLELIQQIQPRGTFVDLGCAYGYLVREAREHGFRAFGFDISSYALRQEPSISGLVQANLLELPLKSGSADVVAVFDTLEHLHDPLRALDEAVRILSPEGLLVGATPDPLFFGRFEETHFSERPPSFWISALEDRGLKVQFRFSVNAYNFQFMASFENAGTAGQIQAFQHDFVGLGRDFIQSQGKVRAVPRFGWSTLGKGNSRVIEDYKAAVYLLNSEPQPKRIRIRFQLSHPPDFCTLGLRFNGLPLTEISVNPELTSREVELPEFLLPEGGHHLFLGITSGHTEFRFSDFEISASEATAGELTLGLPFDLYQRYQLAAQLCHVVSPESVLDIGGILGDQDGHLATSADFLRTEQTGIVHTTDLRQADHPAHRPAPAWNQPFEDESFDMVVSLDVLEHLPRDARVLFLKEIDRVARRWIILGTPTCSPRVETIERHLAETVMAEHGFLSEHAKHGLPKVEEVEDFFSNVPERWIYRLPNGYLYRWAILQTLTQLYFSLGDGAVFRAFNVMYNRDFYRHDQRLPSYRAIWLIGKKPLSATQSRSLHSLLSSEEDLTPVLESELVEHDDFFALHKELRTRFRESKAHRGDLQFLANERQKLIRLLNQEITGLKSRIEELETKPVWRIVLFKLRKKLRKGRGKVSRQP